MIAIQTKFIGPTSTRGARIKAFTMHPGQSLIMPCPGGEGEHPHRIVAQALADKMLWGGKLIGGTVKNGYVFVFEQILSNAQITERGEALINILQLKQDHDVAGSKYKPARYKTTYGSKAAVGVFYTVKRILEEGE